MQRSHKNEGRGMVSGLTINISEEKNNGMANSGTAHSLPTNLLSGPLILIRFTESCLPGLSAMGSSTRLGISRSGRILRSFGRLLQVAMAREPASR